MPMVQFRNEVAGVSETRRMPAPKRAASLEHWLKEARKALPSIPDVAKGDWYVFNHEVDPNWIKWVLHEKHSGKRAYVVIDRRAPSIG